MEFSPNNKIVKLCMEGMEMEDKGHPVKALKFFIQAWNEGGNDFEKFIAAHYVTRHQKTVPDRLKWLETGLNYALKINDDAVKAAFPLLYGNIASCYVELGDYENAKVNQELANQYKNKPTDQGPFYHGTKANLEAGDLLTAGGKSNYKSELVMNHIYFTAIVSGAGLAASLAKGDGVARVYVVAPTGKFENDPNVTNKKFPGNPTRSYRSQEPIKVIGEITDWARISPGELKEWQEKLANNKGEIIN